MTKDKKELKKVKQFEKQNTRLRQENDLLKKWQRFLEEAIKRSTYKYIIVIMSLFSRRILNGLLMET